MSKRLKKKSNKRKYTAKRNPYKSYCNAEWEWINLFIRIDDLKMNNISRPFKLVSNET